MDRIHARIFLRTHARVVLHVMVIALLFSVLTLPAQAPAGPIANRIKHTFEPISVLGITGLECRCSFSLQTDSNKRFWLFRAEPKITGVDPDGPAAGKLKRGDVIVAIDGLLITTRKAGSRFADITPGTPVELTIRRGDRTISETIVPEIASSGIELMIKGLDSTLDEIALQLSKSVESLATISLELPESLEIPEAEIPSVMELLELPELAELRALKAKIPKLPIHDLLPPGRFGFGLSFSGSVVHGSYKKPAKWDFDSPPKIISIHPDTPAERAGLESGDVLTHIDGVRLDSKKGGKRFSSIQPGQEVEWTIERHGVKRTVKMVAGGRGDFILPDLPKVPIPEPVLGLEAHELRYKGSLGETQIEVTGDPSVEVIVDEARGRITIKSRDATIRLRLTEKKR